MERTALQQGRAMVRRARSGEWDRILEILETANFHRIGGLEMPEFPLSDCFVAEVEGLVVGVAGYRILSPTLAKTTLLAVHPDFRRGGSVGAALQRTRMDYVKTLGVRKLRTNVDDPRVARWYERRFGYRRTGALVPKTEPFGREDVDHWTTLEVDLV